MFVVVLRLNVELFDNINVLICLIVLFGVNRLVLCVFGVLFMICML